MNGYSIQKELFKMIKCILALIFTVINLGGFENKIEYKISEFWGKWEVVNVRQYRGGLTEEGVIKQFIGKYFIISTNQYVSMTAKVPFPVFAFNTINNQTVEGVVPSGLQRQISAFYGYEPERKNVILLEIYSTKGGKESKYTHCEILSKDSLLFTYDGWWLFTRRK